MCVLFIVLFGVSLSLHGFVLLHLPNTKKGVSKSPVCCSNTGPKKIKERKTMKTKTKQLEQEQNQKNGHHMEGFQ